MHSHQQDAFTEWYCAVARAVRIPCAGSAQSARDAASAFVTLCPAFVPQRGTVLLSFSGGRTSGVMLRLFHDLGFLDQGAFVVFANTGKERDETLNFVRDCQQRWGVSIRWLEYARKFWPKYKSAASCVRQELVVAGTERTYENAAGKREPGFREVSYETADRVGGPFENMIDLSGLPNFATPHCSTELKTRVIKRFMLAQGCKQWQSVVGLRADEPIRVARMRAPTKQRWDNWLPLAECGIEEEHVMQFWAAQPFDLQLKQAEGNCDLCFKKSDIKRHAIAQDNPERALWWAEQEDRTNSVFRKHAQNYRAIYLSVIGQETCSLADNGSGDCVCHD